MLDFKTIMVNSTYTINLHYLNRYINFINHLKDYDFGNSYMEIHHILPRSLFPEYIKDKNNLIKISARSHYICHWMLAKIFNGKMWFAFNQMKRVIHHNTKKGILYEISRKYISKAISENNTGNVMSVENKEAMSKRHKNTILVYDPELERNVRLSCNDPRYVNKEILPLQVGRTHTESYKKMMSKKYKGRIACVNKNDELIYVYNEDEIPEGFTRGMPSKYYGDSTCLNTIWIYDSVTKTQKRIPKDNPIPKNWVNSRVNGGGFNIINSSNKNKYINLITLQYEFLEKHEAKEYHYIFEGQKIENIKVYEYTNTVILGNTNLLKFLKQRNIHIPIKFFKDIHVKLPIPHYNNSQLVKDFLNIHNNKTLYELGFKKYSLLELKYTKTYTLFF